MKSNTQMMIGQSKCPYCSSKTVQSIKKAAKKSYRRRFKQSYKTNIDVDDLNEIIIDPTSYGYID